MTDSKHLAKKRDIFFNDCICRNAMLMELNVLSIELVSTVPSANPTRPLGWKIVNASDWEKIFFF